MSTALQITAKDNGPAVAGDILAPTINIGAGVPALMAGTTTIDGVVGGTETGGMNVGYRRVVSLDLSAKQYVQFQAARDSGTFSASRKWAAGGAAIIVFQDAAGHWSAFKFHGGDDSWGPFASAIEGYFGAFSGFGSGSTTPAFDLDKSRAPDWSSGTLDWATIAAWEVHLPQMPGGSNPRGVVVGKIQVADPPISTGSVGTLFTDLSSAWTAGGYKYEVVGTIAYAKATAAAVYCPHIGFQLGDGTTTTTGTLNSYSVAFWNCPEDTHDTASPFFDGTGAMVLASAPRLVDHFQAAGDSVTWNDCQFASSRLWGWRTRGSTSATCAVNRCVFTRAAQFECAHGAYTDCIWDGHTAAIQVTANTVITRGTIRNGVGHGLRITGGAGSYSALNVAFGSNSTFDIEVGSGGAGIYNLPNISVVGAYTLKIRNTSATNAITVAIPAGIAFTTSTAGGTISVTTPPTFQSVTISGLIAGSLVQIYDTTNLVELFNATATGTSVTWTDSVAAAGNRAIRVRVAKVSGTTAKAFLEANIGTCGTSSTTAALSYLANQVDDPVYNANAIDGSTVTGITISDAIDRVLISAAGGSKTYPQIYAYQCWWLSTTAGIIDDGAFITAVDTANYLFAGFQIRNTSTTALTITGGYGRDSTTGTSAALIDTAGSSGNIFLAPDHVVPFSTGSGLTSGQAADLTAIASATANLSFSGGAVNANVAKVAGATIRGSGAAGDPWGP